MSVEQREQTEQRPMTTEWTNYKVRLTQVERADWQATANQHHNGRVSEMLKALVKNYRQQLREEQQFELEMEAHPECFEIVDGEWVRK